ncbi:MAG: site-specific DNA-methyltransferase [Gammaproteobacteria bacterium]|nr:MAG: site-specific DNA-methyltransferase [Gammaproteobacteria bacterium]
MENHCVVPIRNPRIEIVYQPIDQLKPDPRNARRHSRRQVQQIADSIEAFGFNVPILIDAELKVIAGHGRLLACNYLGRKEVPTISLEHLSPAQVRAFMIADNRLTEIATWDDRLLGEQLRELSELNLDFSLELTGFDMAEIDLLIEGACGIPDSDAEDGHPPIGSGPTITRAGDLWILGRHRIHCGSALDEEAYRVLMEGDRAVMIFIDPPYNVPIEGHVSGLGAIRHREFAMASGEMNEAQFTEFLARAFGLLARFSLEGALHFICMDWRHMGELLAAGKRAYTELKNLCVWAKDNAGMGSLYRSQHELVFVFKHGRDPHQNNVQLGRYGRNRSNVWNYPGVNSFSRSGTEGNLLALHPTVKPVALVADALRDCSSRGEIVLDAFLGSGTTLIAAERTGRNCRGLELEPAYVDTAIRRWQALTGERARHAGSGRLFEENHPEIGAAA